MAKSNTEKIAIIVEQIAQLEKSHEKYVYT